jgi:hypothetical protein
MEIGSKNLVGNQDPPGFFFYGPAFPYRRNFPAKEKASPVPICVKITADKNADPLPSSKALHSRHPGIRRGAPAPPGAVGAGRGDWDRLLQVTAPAGYGKTMLLCEWCGKGKHQFYWLSLDEGDNNPAEFWNNLAGALARHVPNLLEPIQTVLQSDPLHPLPPGLTLAVLVNALAQETKPPVLVLDDYHLIHAE